MVESSPATPSAGSSCPTAAARSASRGNAASTAAAARRTAPPTPPAAIGSTAIIACPNCRARFRLTTGESRRASCRRCGTRLIIRRCSGLEYRADVESDDTVAGMICDWLNADGSADEADVPAGANASGAMA